MSRYFTPETKQKMKDAWTDDRKETFGETVRQRYKDDPKYGQAVSDKHKGKPKSEEQKYKMSQAKLGVRKSEEHKLNMRKAHQKRNAILILLMDDGLTRKDALQELKEHKEYYYDIYNKTGKIK